MSENTDNNVEEIGSGTDSTEADLPMETEPVTEQEETDAEIPDVWNSTHRQPALYGWHRNCCLKVTAHRH